MPKDSVHSSNNVSKDESVREKEERLREKLKQKAERRKQSDPPRSPNRQPRIDAQVNGGNQDASSRRSNRGGSRDERHRRNNSTGPKMSSVRGPRDYRGRERRKNHRRCHRSMPDTIRPYYPPHEHFGGGYEPHQYSYRNAPPDRRSRVEPPRWEREEYFEVNRDRAPYPDYGRYDRYVRDRDSLDYYDDRGRIERGRRRTSSRSFSRSRSRSISNSSYSSRSRSSSRSYSSSSSRSRSSISNGSSRRLSKSVSKSRSRSHSRSYSKKTDTSRSPSSSIEPVRNPQQIKEDEFTKEQRTVLVSQLVMKADERDIRRYFRKKLGFKVNDVILLRDKRTGRHKGCAYVELANLGDVDRVMEASGKIPDFQRFPIMIKASETNKHKRQAVDTDIRIEAQKVYIGNIDQNITQSQLYAIFSQFGELERVLLQVDIATGLSKGYAFLSYHDPKVSNLAIVAMSGQMLGNKAIKTGWANQNSAAPGIKEVQSNEFPEDAVARIERANIAFKQLNGTGLAQTHGILLVPGMASRVLAYQALSPDASKNQIIAIAEEAVNLALGILPSGTPSTVPLPISLPPIDDNNPKCVKGDLSKHILVRNMFDKDEETEENWAEEIKAEFEVESSKYGTIQNVIVVSNEVGGKIYAKFDSIEGAASCAENLAGRWFDKRQLQVEFVDEIPSR